MENLENYKIASLELTLERKGDLLYHEGPLLTHFINSKNANEHYFYKWSDIDENCNRWLIFKVSVENLISFFEGNLTLLELIQKNQFVYFVDLDTEINEVNAFICPTGKVPDDYLPSERSFFKESQYEKYALTLKNELQKEQERTDEKDIFETLLKEILLIKENQKQQSLLLNSILKNFDKKQSNPKDIQWFMNKEKEYSIDFSDSATINSLINTQFYSNYEQILN
jgi:hypothetical protein